MKRFSRILILLFPKGFSFLFLLLLLIIVFLFLFNPFTLPTVQAQEITKVKGSKALLNVDGLNVSSGDEVFALRNDKPVGLLKIQAIKNGQAVSLIVKGKVKEGMRIKAREQKGSRRKTDSLSESRYSDSRDSSSSQKRKAIGALVGFSINSMSLKAQKKVTSPSAKIVSETLNLTGNGSNVKFFFDYPLSTSFTLRFGLAYENFLATTTTSSEETKVVCNDSKTCTVNLQYMGGDGNIYWNFGIGKSKAHLGVGFSYLSSMSASQNIANLDSSSTASSSIVLLGGGADINIGRNGFIPIVVEYGLYPGVVNVNVSTIYLRIGYGFKL